MNNRLFLILIFSLFDTTLHAADLKAFYRQGINNNLGLKSVNKLYESQLMQQKQAITLWTPKVAAEFGVARFAYDTNSDGSFPGAGAGAGAGAGGNSPNNSGDENANIEFIEAKQRLFDLSAFKLLKLAGKEKQISHLFLNNGKEKFLQKLVEMYFNCLTAKEAIKSAQSYKALSQYSLTLAEQNYELQLSTVEKYYEAKAQYQSALKDEHQAKQDYKESLAYLNQYAQTHYQNVRSLKHDVLLHLPHPHNKKYWIAKGLERNTLLNMDRLKLEAKKIEYKQYLAKHLPTADLIGLLYKGNNVFPTPATLPLLSISSNLKYQGAVIGARFKMPLFTGGQLPIKVKKIAYDIQYQILQNREHQQLIKIDISVLYDNMALYLEEIKETKAQMLANKEVVTIKQNMLKLQKGSYFDYLGAVSKYKKSVDDHFRARHKYIVNIVKLRRLSGTLNEASINKINRFLV